MIRNLEKSKNVQDSSYMGFMLCMICNDKKDYVKYKLGSLDDVSEERLQQMKILEVLDKLSFPMNDAGTYFYKDMIVKVMRYLDGTDDFGNSISTNELLQQLKQPYSQFYFDLARNELDLGIKSFHSYIEQALERVQYEKANLSLLLDIYSNFSRETDYGEHALIIGQYLKKSKIKSEGVQYTLVPSEI